MSDILVDGVSSSGCVVNNGGTMLVKNGGIAVDTTVLTGGTVTAANQGYLMGTTVSAGGQMILSSGSILTGSLTLYAGAVVSACTGATVDFRIADQVNQTVPLYNNLSLISGLSDAMITITVQTTGQSNGTYVLADGYSSYDKSITIKNTDGVVLGTLSAEPSKLVINGKDYSLFSLGTTLKLTISDFLDPASSRSISGDLDGNGISDVMFQYTGGDYQIGYWMNGTSEWRATGAPQPTEWDLLGSYDMDASGKADAVMFGNVLGGAYIGYYKDGDTTGNGWVTIGYLNNAEKIVWRNAVGNLTGNASKNSIVWHAPELSAVGVWTDGTTNWVSISGGFDKNWTLKGCGDFNGDGKDDVLFSFNGNYYSIDIDGSFASLGGFGSGWEVRSIGDFSHDGQDDIVLFHEATGSVVKCENGLATAWSSLGQLDAIDWFVVGAGDYNGDQKDDLLVRQYSTGMLGYYDGGDMSKWVELGRGVDMKWTVIA